jgi:hypothetical protein
VSPAATAAIACHATVTWMLHDHDGRHVPNSPALAGGDPDLAACHDALITAETIVPAGLADTFDLELTIWACLANARLAQQLATEQTGRQEQGLAA